MSRLESSETTTPGQSTCGSEAGSAVEIIRWVFPESLARLLPNPARALAGAHGNATPLARVPVLIGRGDDCDVQLAGSQTSRHHAEVVRVGPVLGVRDLGSRNGIFVNGVRVSEAPLLEGSVLRLGECVGVVTRERPSASAFAFDEFAEGLFGGPVLGGVVELARRGSVSTLPVIIEGETGTGKELFARAVHAWSGRPGPFRAVNCAALPEGLAEAELFGYRKGAFTGAERASLGHLRAAAGGTLLLDEIVDMPLSLQAKLLRALEQQEVLPLGETEPVAIDVRVVSAAQSSLSQAVSEHKFRSDLLARLDGLRVRLPPLRERVEEIPWLFQRLLHRHSGGRPPAVEARLIEQLCLYDWPFNVRELDLHVRRLLALHGHEPPLKRSHLPAHLLEWQATGSRMAQREAAASPEPGVSGCAPTLTQQERDRRDFEALTAALRDSRGNVARAAVTTGISRQRAYRLMGDQADVKLRELRSKSVIGGCEENIAAPRIGELAPAK